MISISGFQGDLEANTYCSKIHIELLSEFFENKPGFSKCNFGTIAVIMKSMYASRYCAVQVGKAKHCTS